MTSYQTLPRPRGIYVPLFDPVARRALVNLAERECRDPKEQAMWLILEGLRAARALPDPQPDPEPAEPVPA